MGCCFAKYHGAKQVEFCQNCWNVGGTIWILFGAVIEGDRLHLVDPVVLAWSVVVSIHGRQREDFSDAVSCSSFSFCVAPVRWTTIVVLLKSVQFVHEVVVGRIVAALHRRAHWSGVVGIGNACEAGCVGGAFFFDPFAPSFA